MPQSEVIIILLAGIATLGIFSFLIKENPIYRVFEHIFVGIAAAYIPLVTIKTFLYPEVIQPLVTSPTEGMNYLLILPITIGLLYYTIYIPRLQFIARMVIGLTLGASAGLSFQGFFAEVTPQIQSSLKPLLTFESVLFLSILVATLYYFFFTVERHGKIGRFTATYARSWMMICFGAFFGSTVTARLALLVERLQFLTQTWFPTIKSYISSILI
jgi:hypothetical protein